MHPESVCPFLGMVEDSQTYYQYASNWNQCHRPARPSSVSMQHQAEYCLSAEHVNCPVFKSDWEGEFPVQFTSHHGGRRTSQDAAGQGALSRRSLLLVLAAILIILVAIGAVLAWRLPAVRGILGLDNTPAEETAGAGVGQTATAALEPTATAPPTASPPPTQTPPPTETAMPSATPAPTETPLPTNTPFPTPGPGFETPFGPDLGFLIHVVQPGESFTSIAQAFSTTSEVLQAINPTIEGASLWAGRQIVVPIGADGSEDLPIFIVVFTGEQVELQELADFYGSDPEGIRFYNALGPESGVPAGRWLIVPVEPES